jgi:phosphate transport system permease protein
MARAASDASTATTTPVRQRFQTARSTLFIDGFMTYFITVGGLAVIIAVLGIFVFILSQILPLFQGARVQKLHTVELPEKTYAVLGADEWTELPFVMTTDGTLLFVDMTGKRQVFPAAALGFDDEKTFSAFDYNQQRQQAVYATSDGHFSVVNINYQPTFAGDTRTIVATPRAGPFFAIGQPEHPITSIVYGDAGEQKLAVAIQEVAGQRQVHAVSLKQKRTLLGAGKTAIDHTYELTSLLKGQAQFVAVNAPADAVIVTTQAGDVYYFFRDGEELSLRQVFTPFRDRDNPAISSVDFLFGGVSLVFTSASGVNRIFSLYIPEGGNKRLFGQTKTFAPLPGPASFYARSLRNKAFLVGTESWASLRYATTETVRWQQALPFTATKALLGGKYDRLIFLDAAHTLHFYTLHDPHPESGFKALFAKIWYEGASAPRHVWQSTGATDDFEAKLSLVPVIIGSLKGTLYAMLFAVPVALLAAIYTSQFLHPDLRVLVKPTMEIMASLPSVILGFLAALWLAPLLETRIPSFLLIVTVIPLTALSFGWFWSSLPRTYRRCIKPATSFWRLCPFCWS